MYPLGLRTQGYQWNVGLSAFFRAIGGAEGNRTPDLHVANVALSQLSYGPFILTSPSPWRHQDTGLGNMVCPEYSDLNGNGGIMCLPPFAVKPFLPISGKGKTPVPSALPYFYLVVRV